MTAPYPFARQCEQIVADWAELLAKRSGRTVDEVRAEPTRLADFQSGILRIVLLDDSQVEFRWAFALIDESRHAIAVFTEHCGYYNFPIYGAEVSRDGVVEYEHEARKRDRENWPDEA